MAELRSFAKLNLGLEVTGRRADGYHTLDTLFQTIDFFDEIDIVPNRSGRIEVFGSDPRIAWDETNTVSRAIHAVLDRYSLEEGFTVRVKKNIPPGAGLGGGSGNAAVILLYLNSYFGLDLSLAELTALATAIGADVPFFLLGGTAHAQGIGDILSPAPPLGERWFALVTPPLEVPTGMVFSRLSLTNRARAGTMTTFLETGDFSVLENHLEPVSFACFPQIGQIKAQMANLDLDMVLMSGSGATVFGLLRDRGQIPRVKDAIPGVRFCRSVGRAEYQERIGASPSGKASVFGADIRRFESSRPSTFHHG